MTHNDESISGQPLSRRRLVTTGAAALTGTAMLASPVRAYGAGSGAAPNTLQAQMSSETDDAGSGVKPSAISAAGFCFRWNWGYRNGWWRLSLNYGSITAATQVFVSISEHDAYGNPFIGSAHYTVHNVAPYNNGVAIVIYVDWGSPILTHADYFVCTS
jgi:hypothetical protein